MKFNMVDESIDGLKTNVLVGNDEYVVIKVPGHSMYMGNKIGVVYKKAEIIVYKILGKDQEGLYNISELLRFRPS